MYGRSTNGWLLGENPVPYLVWIRDFTNILGEPCDPESDLLHCSERTGARSLLLVRNDSCDRKLASRHHEH